MRRARTTAGALGRLRPAAPHHSLGTRVSPRGPPGPLLPAARSVQRWCCGPFAARRGCDSLAREFASCRPGSRIARAKLLRRGPSPSQVCVRRGHVAVCPALEPSPPAHAVAGTQRSAKAASQPAAGCGHSLSGRGAPRTAGEPAHRRRPPSESLAVAASPPPPSVFLACRFDWQPRCPPQRPGVSGASGPRHPVPEQAASSR